MNLLNILKIDKNIRKLITYLTELLTEKGLYDSSLDIQIFNVACLLFQYNKLVNTFVTESTIIEQDVRGGGTSRKKNPILNELVNCSESLRKNLKELGLSLDAKVTAVADTDPLSNLISAMNNIDNE
jgi:hypothetical protein